MNILVDADACPGTIRDIVCRAGMKRGIAVLFVANHAFDCIGAKAAGMRTAFIDRRSRPFGRTPHQPDILVPTMTDLADALA